MFATVCSCVAIPVSTASLPQPQQLQLYIETAAQHEAAKAGQPVQQAVSPANDVNGNDSTATDINADAASGNRAPGGATHSQGIAGGSSNSSHHAAVSSEEPSTSHAVTASDAHAPSDKVLSHVLSSSGSSSGGNLQSSQSAPRTLHQQSQTQQSQQQVKQHKKLARDRSAQVAPVALDKQQSDNAATFQQRQKQHGSTQPGSQAPQSSTTNSSKQPKQHARTQQAATAPAAPHVPAQGATPSMPTAAAPATGATPPSAQELLGLIFSAASLAGLQQLLSSYKSHMVTAHHMALWLRLPAVAVTQIDDTTEAAAAVQVSDARWYCCVGCRLCMG